jgi:hypothetical protein
MWPTFMPGANGVLPLKVSDMFEMDHVALSHGAFDCRQGFLGKLLFHGILRLFTDIDGCFYGH